jgi:ribonucleotide reductase alpha subunit
MINSFRQPISNNLFERKYCLYKEKTAEEVFMGISSENASNEKEFEKWKKIFYNTIVSGELIPAGRILANARPHSLMKNYNNCYTIDIEDSMDSIFNSLKEDALISKVGGGVGFNVSKLRPKGSKISTGGESSGIMSFLEVFDASAKVIHTGGGRRSAHIAILNVDHPDIEEFITYKQGDENKRLTQFNISVGITDKFLNAVENDEDWDLVFEGEIYKTLKAKDLYDKIAKHAWWYNEPGVLFLDTVEKDNNGHHAFKMDRTNPCVAQGTLVDTLEGLRKVEDIKEGDLVSTLHEKGFEPVKTIEIHEDTYVNKVTFSNNITQYVTDAHIYHVKDQKSNSIIRKRMDNLFIGDKVQYQPLDKLRKVYLDIEESYITEDNNYYQEILDIEWHVKKEKVYDLFCEESDTWITEGLVQQGCGEITMPSYSLCCLSSINLSKFVRYPFTEDAYFDFDRYKDVIKIGVRFLDNILDVTEYPLEKIKELSLNWRRIGLGITGLADAMLMLGIKYGTSPSLEFVNALGHNLANESYRASVDLAKEKGSFPAFDENIGNYGFIKKLDLEIQKDIKKYGLRNIGLNTIAPVGTTSLTVGNNCSSGIEPIFALQYDRTIRNDDSTTYTETIYDNGWLEFLDYSAENNLEIDPESLPDYIVSSHDIPIKAGIDVQSSFQYWIDHSISKTINIPYETTLEEYKDIFMYSWSKGLKGVTSFHDGASMEGIFSTNKKEVKRHAEKRPKVLPCDIYEMQVNKQRVLALVGLLNDKPYEVFLTDDPDDVINVQHAKQGTITKVKTNCYELSIKSKRGEYILHDISSVFDVAWGTLGRLVSMSLRHNVPLQFIVDQLNKTKRFGTFSKGMARVLKKYIKEGETVLSAEKCPECGKDLIFKEGCKSCSNCGWSKC